MRITKLSLTNFRSFKETQTIEFAPVTLLFGPNSVGKSTVLMALFYLQQILDKGQCNPQRIDALGGKFVGGFENLVNGKDLTKPITIAVEYDKGDAIGHSYANLLDLVDYGTDYPLSSPIIDARKIKIEVEIAGHRDTQNRNNAYVRRYKVWFDGEELIEVNSDSSGKQPFITTINYAHPNFLDDNHNDHISAQFDDREAMHEANYDLLCQLKNIENPSHRDITQGAEIPFEDLMDSGELEFDDSLFFSQLHSLVNEGREGNNPQKVVIEGNSFVHVSVGIKGNSGALPKLGNVIKSTLDNGSEQVCRVLEEVLSDMLVAPLDNLKAILQESLCIGPLREIPDPTYQSAPYSESKDWFSGKAAWDILAQGNSHFAKRVSIWTSSKDKLNLGIGLAVKRTSENTQYKIYASDKNTHQYNSDRYTQGAFDTLEHEFNVLKELSLQFQNMLADNYNEYIQAKEQDSEKHSTHARELQEMFHDQQIKTECHIVELIDKQRNQLLKSTPTTVIWDLKKSMEVSPIDLGVGISQLLPFVVAALAIKKGIIAVEQPELHVHPRVQVGIGDLLTQVDTKANFLIETHSEHIILRILRRIRETSDNELPEGFKPVTKEDVSIVYLEPSENGVTTKRIEIDDDGEFIDRWPHGFFSERRDEVM